MFAVVCLCEEPSVLSSVHESEMGWSDGICALTDLPPLLHLSSLPTLTSLPCVFLSDYTVQCALDSECKVAQ